jgi:pimeloyl-ACP methyl ester carboxylesterase
MLDATPPRPVSVEERIFECDGERLTCSVASASPVDPVDRVDGSPGTPTAVLLHGAGRGSKERLLGLLADFAARGCRAVAFDFSGHGGSTGTLADLSLERRFTQARAVIDAYVPAGDPLLLVGFSMSGQSVADLTAHYGPRVVALGLCAPAVYAERAWPVPFGGGFTEIIRTPESWRDSPALRVYGEFTGRAVLAVPAHDAVIPPAVTEALAAALGRRSDFTRLVLDEANHQLGLWLGDHPGERARLADTLLGRGLATTRAWVEDSLPDGERVTGAEPLHGGWTSEMRRLRVESPGGGRQLVLRSFVKPFYRRHAESLLTREAAVLTLLDGTDIPAARLLAVDATGSRCDDPSLLMSLLPGDVRLADEGAEARAVLLARQLVRIHAVAVTDATRPRTYEAWTSPQRVGVPEATSRAGLWRRAVEVISGEPPAYEARFLHRDFHPGNVLFSGEGAGQRVSGVVDWVETSWGPTDLDVAHCSTALGLLHGPEVATVFADAYTAAGGRLSEDPAGRLYWRLLDALAFAPDAEKVAIPWRRLGRTDLTPEVLTDRLEEYIAGLFTRFG